MMMSMKKHMKTGYYKKCRRFSRTYAGHCARRILTVFAIFKLSSTVSLFFFFFAAGGMRSEFQQVRSHTDLM